MLSERLKQATQAHHERAEHSLTILMSPALTLPIYTEIIARFHRLYVSWESPAANTLASEPEWFAAFDERRKRNVLEADLRALGKDDAWIALQADREVEPRLPTRSMAEVLGTMYVLEGSTLGGQIIAKQLERHLHLRDGHGYSYFRGAGPQTMTRWRTFKAILDRTVAPQDESTVIESAMATFDHIRSLMSERKACQEPVAFGVVHPR